MNASMLSGAIVILAGSIAISAGVIAEAIERHQSDPAYLVGTILLLFGGAVFLKPLWDAIPVDGGKKKNGGTDDREQDRG